MHRKNVILVSMIVLIAFVLAVSVAMASQKVVKSIKKKEIIDYQIVPNDTLWDISDSFYGDPWLWPKIWDLNPYIDDPHWIYPENKLKIAISEDYLETYWKKGKLEWTPLTIFDPTFQYKTRNNRIDMISPEKLQGAGEIVDHIDDKILIGIFDTVYFTMDKKENVQIGDIFTVFHIEKKVKHPINKKTVGYQVNLGGEIKTVEANVLKSGKIVYTGEIIDSSFEMSVGDPLIPMSRKEVSIQLKESSLDISGYIIEEMDGKLNFAEHDICFIDLGIKHGIMPGNSFSVYRASKDKKKLPPYFIGNLIVLKVQDNNATCLVTNSLREMQLGDAIRSDITAELE